MSGHFIAVGDDKRIYWNDTKRACCDYQLGDTAGKKFYWCEAESNSINNNGVCTSTFSTGDKHLNLFAIWNIHPCATHLLLAELA